MPHTIHTSFTHSIGGRGSGGFVWRSVGPFCYTDPAREHPPVASDRIQLGNFVLDVGAQTLLHRGRQVAMRQKAWLVLRRLAEQPGVLISADELHETAWPGLAVTPQTLTNVIGELRKVARADPGGSLRIETRYGRGYRLLIGTGAASPERDPSTSIFVGRDREIAALRALWQKTLAGTRQIVSIAGAAGIGKTALVDQFVAGLPGDAPVALGRGRCVVRRAQTETYAPLLDALEEISRDVDLVEDMRRWAPSWLAQMPWLLPADEMMALRRSLAGIGASRLLREGIKLLEEVSARIPIVLVLEDAHGADASTVDLLSALIERTTPARLLALVTLRTPDAFLRRGALSSMAPSVWRTPSVTRMLVEPLSPTSIRSYLARRFPGPGVDAAAASAFEEVSGGNPLFLQEVVDTLVERRCLVEDGRGWRLEVTPEILRTMLPEGVRDLIDEHVAQLGGEQTALLEAAAAAGVEFTTSVVAAAVERPVDEVAHACGALATLGHFVMPDGERVMPDGSVVDAFRFTHALYQQSLAARPTAARRRSLHARIGEQLEREYGARVDEIASRLALHFELADAPAKQLVYLQLAAVGAATRSAYRETADLVWRAIEVTRRLPDPSAVLARVELLLAYGNVRLLLGGLRDPRAQRAYDEAHAETILLGDDVLRFRTQLGRCVSALFRGAPDVDAIAGDLVRIATGGHPELAAAAHLYDGYVKHARGDVVASAESGRRAHEMLPHARLDIPRDVCLEAHVLVHLARTAALSGDVDASAGLLAQTAAVAREHATPADRVAILGHLASTAMVAADPEAALALAEEAIGLGERHGIDQHPVPGLAVTCSAWARCLLGRGTSADLAGAIDRREQGGEVWYQGVLLVLLAEVQISEGDVDRAGATLARAAAMGEALWQAELERVHGELALATGDASAARRRFGEATRIAVGQGAILFAQRARAALARVAARS